MNEIFIQLELCKKINKERRQRNIAVTFAIICLIGWISTVLMYSYILMHLK
jgi:hypothetical protein